MLAVISDLHFSHEQGDFIRSAGGDLDLVHVRNLPAKPYRRFIASLAAEACRNGARSLDFVLAGDIFDLHRTPLWLEAGESLRPYVPSSQVDAALEAKVLEILDAIAAEPAVADTLAALRLLAAGRFLDGTQREFPVPVTLHCIPGNHDRLINATPAIRRRVRGLLGLGDSGDRFANQLRFSDPPVLVRHGHEYDRFNFSADPARQERIADQLPAAQYDAPTLGDFVTVDVASRMPWEYRRLHGRERILASPLLRAVYLHLLEFDDLRPQSAMLDFLLSIPQPGITPRRVWPAIEPVLVQLLENVHASPFLGQWLGRLEKQWWPDGIDWLQLYLGIRGWRGGIARSVATALARRIREDASGGGPAAAAMREQLVLDGQVACVIAGHTHRPQVALLAADHRGERYYIDTGTWRNRVPASPDRRQFGRLKALTYAVLYGSDEDRGEAAGGGRKLWSFDYWSGYTQRWLAGTPE